MAPTTVSGRARLKLARLFSVRLTFRSRPFPRILYLFADPHALPKADRSTPARTGTDMWEELATPAQVTQLARLARRRRWGLSLILLGWLHLLAFALCYYMTIIMNYNDAPGYLAVWGAELCGMALIFRLCGGPRSAEPPLPLARFVVRIWTTYFLLAFNLCSMNALRGHRMFELFPAMASLASFAFLAMSFIINRRFYLAVLVMFAAGLLEAAHLPHAFLVFALAWWLVLNGVGFSLLWRHRLHPTDEKQQLDAPLPAYSPMILTNTRLGRPPSNSP